MSKETKQALNLYTILDNEMTRMHALLQTYMTLPQPDSHSTYGRLSAGRSFSSHSGLPEIYKRILKMQDLLLEAVVSHDEVIQNKVAELALTGDADETKV